MKWLHISVKSLSLVLMISYAAFSALSMLVGRQEGHMACKSISCKTPWDGSYYKWASGWGTV